MEFGEEHKKIRLDILGMTTSTVFRSLTNRIISKLSWEKIPLVQPYAAIFMESTGTIENKRATWPFPDFFLGMTSIIDQVGSPQNSMHVLFTCHVPEAALLCPGRCQEKTRGGEVHQQLGQRWSSKVSMPFAKEKKIQMFFLIPHLLPPNDSLIHFSFSCLCAIQIIQVDRAGTYLWTRRGLEVTVHCYSA